MWHEDTLPDDQIPAGRGPGGPAPGPAGVAGLLRSDQPQGLHPTPVVRHPVPHDLHQYGLPRRRPVPHRLQRDPRRPRAQGRCPPLLDPVLRGRPAAQKGEVVCLLVCATTSATGRGLIGDKPTAAVDGTGLESRHTSRYFFKRAGRKHTPRLWTKLTAAVDTKTHFLAGAAATTGPSNDSPQ